jgi:uncharacterized protein (DUF1330 family)
LKRSPDQIRALLEELARHGLGGVNPDREPLRSLVAADRPGPLQFLNLLAFHEAARYPAGHAMAARGLRGAEAYALYGAVAMRHVAQRGGRLVAWNAVEQGLIGAGEGWDQIAIMEYPDSEAFVDMLRDPDYAAALVHRDAGLARTVVLVTRPLLAPAPAAPIA